jgi:excinuclease ABC subunit A
LLFGVLYVLDEPSAGLHPADSQALYDALDRLRDGGNSVFVVEHDLERCAARSGWWMWARRPASGGARSLQWRARRPAPGAGVAHGAYLFDQVPAPARRQRSATHWLELQGIHRHNLQGVDAQVPLGLLTAVTGISGSGKSSLMAQALPELMLLHLGHEPADDGARRRRTTGRR